MIDLSGKVAIVTGGGSGIGAEISRTLARAGAAVCIFGRTAASIDAVVADIARAGGKAMAYRVDVGDEAAYCEAIAAVVAAHGQLDILVNNANQFTFGPLVATTTDDWHRNFTTSVDGTFWGTREAMRHMAASGGAVINISSICGSLGSAYMAGYSAAKAAINNFSRTAAVEGAPQGIRVNVVTPAVVDTPATNGMLSDDAAKAATERLIPMGRVGLPSDIANAVAFLASDLAGYITGVELPVDGGRACALITAL